MNDLPDTLEMLSARVDALEKRVHDLEHPELASVSTAGDATPAPIAGSGHLASGIEQTASVFPILGGAMLGFAGAFLLRALAEFSPTSRRIVAAAAIAYAVAWLVWAARAANTALFARAIYACTSALILAPMLWELTLHFKVLTPVGTAGLLGGFALLAAMLTWKGNLIEISGIANATAALTAIGLSIATRELIPFLLALLLMALLSEIAATRKHGRSIWMLVMLVADLGIGALLFIYSGPATARIEYPTLGLAALLAPACLLFLINSAAITATAVIGKLKITIPQVFQALISFTLAISSAFEFAPRSGIVVFGAAFLLLSLASYFLAFVYLGSAPDRRNPTVLGVWSAGLFIAGALCMLPLEWAAAVLGLAAVGASLLGMRLDSSMLKLHGAAYLTVAAIACGLPRFDFEVLAGSPPSSVRWSIFSFAAAAVVCYAINKEHTSEPWKKKAIQVIAAVLAISVVAALATEGLLRLAALAFAPDVWHVALIRTFTICGIALALAYGSARMQRLEMKRLAYAALVFEAVKLIFEDLHHGRMEFIAASFFIFALTLIAVPRLSRARQRQIIGTESNREQDTTEATVR